MNHKKIEARNQELSDIFSSYEKNTIHPSCDAFKDSKKGIATGGISYTYTMETLKKTGMVKTLKIATPHPFPEKLAVDFLSGLDEVLCLEELDPVIERELIYICGKYHLPTRINGKLSGHTACAGENTRNTITTYINTFLGLTSLSPLISGTAGTAGPPAGTLRRMSSQSFFLRRKKSYERKENRFLRGYRMLYARKCPSSRYG